LQGVRAVVAQSYERIHRSNLIGMGILPLEFLANESAESLGLTGEETYSIPLPEGMKPQQSIEVIARSADGKEKRFATKSRIDTPVEVDYYRNGGILHTVLLQG
jgi:aconitate hydratase